MNGIDIREATEDDLPAILAIYSSAKIERDTGFSLEEARVHFGRFRQYPCFRIFVALVDGVIAGTYELLIMDNLAKRGKKSGVVEDVAVHPPYQGRGVGRAMMEHAQKTCRAADCYKVTLSSNLNREEAHRFYESLGFEPHGYSFRIEVRDAADAV
jgi:ribosomal protein S18 acetylase RimI-like enzyme